MLATVLRGELADYEEDNQKIFYDGQIFDAFSLLTDMIRRAKKEIILIDGYVDVITLNIVAKKKAGVDVEEMLQEKRGQATYAQIKDYVLEQNGLKVSSFLQNHERAYL